jgi:uncharacterized protein YkwD
MPTVVRSRLSPSRRLFALLLLCAIGTAVVAADAGARDRLLAPEHVCPNPALSAAPRIQLGAMLCYHRYARMQAGLPLRRVKSLARAAELKARWIVSCRIFTHSPCGHSFMSGFQQSGYIWGNWLVGENIGWGSGPVGRARPMFVAWLRSAEHRENIVRPRLGEIGIARIQTIRLFGYRDVAVWVTDFGSH